VLVCGGVLLLPPDTTANPNRRFRLTYINGKFIVPALYVTGLILFWNNFTGLFEYPGDWHIFREKLPFYLFMIVATIITVLTFLRNLSLVPVLGLLSCFYLMTELGYTNWMRFLVWLAAGLVIYFVYGRYNSKLATRNDAPAGS
jgi:hypothetical protein